MLSPCRVFCPQDGGTRLWSLLALMSSFIQGLALWGDWIIEEGWGEDSGSLLVPLSDVWSLIGQLTSPPVCSTFTFSAWESISSPLNSVLEATLMQLGDWRSEKLGKLFNCIFSICKKKSGFFLLEGREAEVKINLRNRLIEGKLICGDHAGKLIWGKLMKGIDLGDLSRKNEVWDK